MSDHIRKLLKAIEMAEIMRTQTVNLDMSTARDIHQSLMEFQWKPMNHSDLIKDHNHFVLLRFGPTPEGAPSREESWFIPGRVILANHHPIPEDGFDMGWNMPGAGIGGWTDEWFDGWISLNSIINS